MKLDTNMRAHLSGDDDANDFATLLRPIGDGQILFSAEPDIINIPQSWAQGPSLPEPSCKTVLGQSGWLSGRSSPQPTETSTSSTPG